MAIGKGNALKSDQNISTVVDFNTGNPQKTFKPNTTGKPLAHTFRVHNPNITHPTSAKGADGVLINVGDTVVVDDQVPFEATVKRFVKHKTGIPKATLVLWDGSHVHWYANNIRKKQERQVELGIMSVEEMDQFKREHDGMNIDEFFASEEARLKKEDPTIMDDSVEPQNGLIRTWKVGDVLKNGYKITHFSKRLQVPHVMMATVEKGDSSLAYPVDELWSLIEPENMVRAQGRTKTWFEGYHVQFGHGAEAKVGQIDYFIVGDLPRRKPYAVVSLEGTQKLVPVDQLYKHRLDHNRPLPQVKKPTHKKPDPVKEPDPVKKPEVVLEPPKPQAKVVEPALVKHDVHYSTMHPQKASPEVEPDHELSCPIKHGRSLMQQPKAWEDWFRGTEEWYGYVKAKPSDRAKLRLPAPRDPSNFPVTSFFEVDERTGKNRYGVKPTCVTSSSSRFVASVADPINFRWKFPRSDTITPEKIALWVAWKKYVYDWITLAFGAGYRSGIRPQDHTKPNEAPLCSRI